MTLTIESENIEPPPQSIISFGDIISEQWLSPASLILLVIVIFLLIASALVSGSEIAFFSFKNSDLKEFEDSPNQSERLIYQLINKPRRLLSTILIANNLFNIAMVVVSFYLLAELFDFSNQPKWVEVIIETGLVTFLIVLFGEVIPKVYATQKGKQLARFMARPLQGLSILFWPISRLLMTSTDGLEERILERVEESVSAEEVDMIIDLTTKGKINKEEVQILKSIVHFGDISVNDVMTSRPDIIAVNESISYKELLKQIKTYGFSRLPVYEHDLDHIIGVIYAKDLLEHLDENDNFQWNSLIRDSFFVPENKKIDNLLEDFQSNRTHMAIVVDEYGGTAGLITLEDVLEEIIGDIKDEFDESHSDVEYEKLAEGKYIFEGKTSLFDLCKIIKADFQSLDSYRGDADSIGGLILEMSGKFPRKNQLVQIENFRFKVLDVDKKRIKRVQIEYKS